MQNQQTTELGRTQELCKQHETLQTQQTTTLRNPQQIDSDKNHLQAAFHPNNNNTTEATSQELLHATAEEKLTAQVDPVYCTRAVETRAEFDCQAQKGPAVEQQRNLQQVSEEINRLHQTALHPTLRVPPEDQIKQNIHQQTNKHAAAVERLPTHTQEPRTLARQEFGTSPQLQIAKQGHKNKNAAPTNEQIAHNIAEDTEQSRRNDAAITHERRTHAETTTDDLRRQLEIFRKQQITEQERNRKKEQELRHQVETLQTQHEAELEHNKKEQHLLRKHLEDSKSLQEATLEKNRQICAEKDNLQQQTSLLLKQHAKTIEENHRNCALAQEEKRHLQA